MDQELRRQIPRRTVEHSDLTAAGALIFCRSTYRYLFLLRSGCRYHGNWGLVGGKIEDGESIIQGLYREIQEEIGQDLSGKKIIPVEKFTSDSGKFFYHTYVIIVDHEFAPKLNAEHNRYCWVRLEDHPKPLHPGVWRTFNFESVKEKIKVIENVLELNNNCTSSADGASDSDGSSSP